MIQKLRADGQCFVENNSSHSWALSSTSSVYTAELCAVWQTLRYCKKQSIMKFLTFTDSLSILIFVNESGTVDLLQKSNDHVPQIGKGRVTSFIGMESVPGH